MPCFLQAELQIYSILKKATVNCCTQQYFSTCILVFVGGKMNLENRKHKHFSKEKSVHHLNRNSPLLSL